MKFLRCFIESFVVHYDVLMKEIITSSHFKRYFCKEDTHTYTLSFIFFYLMGIKFFPQGGTGWGEHPWYLETLWTTPGLVQEVKSALCDSLIRAELANLSHLDWLFQLEETLRQSTLTRVASSDNSDLWEAIVSKLYTIDALGAIIAIFKHWHFLTI